MNIFSFLRRVQMNSIGHLSYTEVVAYHPYNFGYSGFGSHGHRTLADGCAGDGVELHGGQLPQESETARQAGAGEAECGYPLFPRKTVWAGNHSKL